MESTRVIGFNKRTGPGQDVFDAGDAEDLGIARDFLAALANELMGGADSLRSTSGSATVRFFDALRRSVARVRLNAALAFETAAEKHRQLVAERAQYKTGKGGGARKPGKERPAELFKVEPVTADDEFAVAFRKWMLYNMAASRERTQAEVTAFFAQVPTISELIQLDQWLTHAARVLTLGARNLGKIGSADDVARVMDAMMGAAKAEDYYAETQGTAVGNRADVLKTMYQTAGHGDRNFARAVTAIHNNKFIQALHERDDARDHMEALVDRIVAHNTQNKGPAAPMNYTNVANHIALELTQEWKKRPTVEQSTADRGNRAFYRFLKDAQLPELKALARTAYIGIEVKQNARADTLRNGIFEALNRKREAGTSAKSASSSSSSSSSSSPARPVAAADDKAGKRRSAGWPRKKDVDDAFACTTAVLDIPFALGRASYLTSPDTDDDTKDFQRATAILEASANAAFRTVVQAYRGKRQNAPRKRRNNNNDDYGGGDGRAEEDQTADESMSDEVNNVIEKAARFLAIYDRCSQMLAPQADDPDAVAPQVPARTGAWASYFHASDAKYHHLHLMRYKSDGGGAAGGKDAFDTQAARRRWWWAYMFVSIVRIDIVQRKGPKAPAKRALLEVAAFLDDPVDFASSDNRRWMVTGPPGTGKTTFVRLLAVMYHLAGLYPLASIDDDAIVILNASDLIAGYEGQTPLRVTEVFVRHIGTFLVLDEAYALVPAKRGAAPSEFGQQVVDQMIVLIGEFASLMGMALVGYSTRILDRLKRANEGFSRRFPRTLNFPEYSARDLVDVFQKALADKRPVMGARAAELRDTVQAFFEFITGEQNSFTFGQTVIRRDEYIEERIDEDDTDFATRREAMRKSATPYGSFFAEENASGALGVATRLLRNKKLRAKPAALSMDDIVDATRFLLLQHNIIDYTDSAMTPEHAKEDETDDADW